MTALRAWQLAWRLALGIFAFVVVAVVVLFAPLPLPPDRVLSEETSPDGLYVATYSWRPAGFLGAVSRDNPWVYVTIREASSGRIVARHRTWGDVPHDAYKRLGDQVPWHASPAR